MSQSRSILSLCLVAACASLAWGQTWDWRGCADGMSQQLTKYTQTVTSSVEEFSSAVSKQGSSALDLQGFSKDTSTLLAQVNSLTDTSQPMDVQRIMKINWEIMQTQMKLSRYFLNPALGLSMFREYMSFNQKLLAANTNFMTAVSSQCVPSNGGRLSAAASV